MNTHTHARTHTFDPSPKHTLYIILTNKSDNFRFQDRLHTQRENDPLTHTHSHALTHTPCPLPPSNELMLYTLTGS